jgi:hypothetical protein
MDKLPSPTWVLAALATLGAPEMAATTARSAPGDPSERVAIHRASPTLPNAEMTEVDEEARTFTVAVVFSAADLEKLPAVGRGPGLDHPAGQVLGAAHGLAARPGGVP